MTHPPAALLVPDVTEAGDMVIPAGAHMSFFHDINDEKSTHVQVIVGAGAVVDYRFLSMGTPCAKPVNVTVHLAGIGARFDMAGAILQGGPARMDMTVTVFHDAPHTESTQNVYAVTGGAARVSYRGKVVVDRSAQKSNARQMCLSDLLSRRAQIITQPELEIYTDDVACTHGATCGALDEQAIFYLTSRGVPRADARELMLAGFLSDAVSPLGDDVQSRVTSALVHLLAQEETP